MTETPPGLTATPDAAPEGPLPFQVISEMLDLVRLEGSIFLRAEMRSPWAYESPPSSELVKMLGPGDYRLVLFHIIASGHCWISVEGGERHELRGGDVVVLPYSDQHIVGSPEPAEVTPIGTLLPPPPWEQLPVIEFGGDGELTEFVCGYLRCHDILFDPVLRALPAVFTVRPEPGPTATWVDASVRYVLEASGPCYVPTPTTRRLPELVFVEMLRVYLESNAAELTGWLAALRDPVVGPALVTLHTQPERDWTVADLARSVACSKSVLDDRFRQLVGRPPIRYLTDWRFQLASGLLRTTDLGVGDIATRVGYTSEEAFSRAFKRKFDESPGRWRHDAESQSGV